MAKPRRILKRILRTLAIIIAVPLALVLLLTGVGFAGSIGWKPEPLPPDASKTLRRASVGERWMTGLGRILDGLTPMPKDIPGAAGYVSENFYPGGESEGEAWRLGYAQAIITPEDWETKTYYEGGNITVPRRTLNHKLDELKVRVIALSAGDGNVNIFAAIDAIGVTNRQARQIRALVADMGLQSVNVASTHVHTGVDTTGIYSEGGKADQDYIAFVNERAAAAIRAAVAAMEPGKLYISSIGQDCFDRWAFYDKYDKLIGFDDETDEWDDAFQQKWDDVMKTVPIEGYGIAGYTGNRRNWQLIPTKLNKLRFVPDNAQSRETVLLNFALHPFLAGWSYGGWKADSISGDFIYYMEELINEAGANMLFHNGAQNGINEQYSSLPSDLKDENGDDIPYAQRPYVLHDKRVRVIGRDLAAIALAMTLPKDGIAASPLLDPANEHGYNYGQTLAMLLGSDAVRETPLAPSLSLRLKELTVAVENPVMRAAAKRGMGNFTVLRNGKELAILTELGYLELGGPQGIAIALLPGEFTPGLAWRGGDTTAEHAIRQRDFAYSTFSESAGRDVLVFGLCNDELGYIIPDGDYLMFYALGWDFFAEKVLGTWNYDHYAELLSPGPSAAGTFAQAFEELAKPASN
ncbi:MAG: hypothetical protein FWF60_00970 [Oscillospiraceae bacterium]|nr:hypothetical protein [Oscillospiraceae bacterium]